MNYKPREQGSNYGHKSRKGNTAFRKRYRDTRKKKHFGITTSEEIREIESSQPISEISEEGKTSVGINLGNQIGNVGISGTKEDKKSTKFPKSADYV
jgi:hypothetical protein